MGKFISIASITLFKGDNQVEESTKWMVINSNYIQCIEPFGDKYYAVSLSGREELILITEPTYRTLCSIFDVVNTIEITDREDGASPVAQPVVTWGCGNQDNFHFS